MFLSQFDRVRVISLADRKDRRRAMIRQGFAFEFFNAIRPPDKGRFASIGFHGSYLSHLAVLKQSRGSVLIVEDDCDIIDRSYSVPECDIFYGSHDEDADVMIGAHCMGFSAKAAKLAADYLSGLLEGSVAPDARATMEPGYDPDILPPIDGAYVWFRRAHPELTTVFRKVAVQRISRSDCTPKHFDSIAALRPLVSIGRQAKAALSAYAG